MAKRHENNNYNNAMDAQNVDAILYYTSADAIQRCLAREVAQFDPKTRPELCPCGWHLLGECKECASRESQEAAAEFEAECEMDERRWV